MTNFSEWLYATSVSSAIRDISWIIPTVQSIHILAITIVIGSALAMDMRFAGLLGTDEPQRRFVARYLPWTWIALAVLVLTGIVMSVGEPDRVLSNQIFWIKMGLVFVGFMLTLFFRRPLLNQSFSLEHATWAGLAKPMAWVSLLVWVCVIFCGRWIAYAI